MEKLLEIMPLLYLDLGAIIIFCTFLVFLRKRSEKIKKRCLYGICCINLLFLIINDFYLYQDGANLLTLMPLQLCNIAVFLVPTAIILNKRPILDFVFYISAPGALGALIVPSSDFLGSTFSLKTISFFTFHFGIAAITFLLVGWGMYKPALTIKKAFKLSIGIFALAIVMHLLNLGLEKEFHVEANYFFTIIKYSAPRNPLFQLFSKIIPYNLFYLLPLLLVVYAYMLIIYGLSRLKLKCIK